MPGMGTGLSTNSPAVVSAFQTALLHQGLVVLLIMSLVAIARNLQRPAQVRRARATALGEQNPLPAYPPEPAARRLLGIAFGLIWVFDSLGSPTGATSAARSPSCGRSGLPTILRSSALPAAPWSGTASSPVSSTPPATPATSWARARGRGRRRQGRRLAWCSPVPSMASSVHADHGGYRE